MLDTRSIPIGLLYLLLNVLLDKFMKRRHMNNLGYRVHHLPDVFGCVDKIYPWRLHNQIWPNENDRVFSDVATTISHQIREDA